VSSLLNGLSAGQFNVKKHALKNLLLMIENVPIENLHSAVREDILNALLSAAEDYPARIAATFARILEWVDMTGFRADFRGIFESVDGWARVKELPSEASNQFCALFEEFGMLE
jgi:hypothetical protein